jgi:hypothetical protein
MNKQFPNGFNSWQETHYEVVAAIQYVFTSDNYEHPVMRVHDLDGTVGLYNLAENITDEFEESFKGRDWGNDIDYYDTIHKFIMTKFKEL